MHIFTTIKFNFITLIMGMGITLVIGYAIGYFLRKLFTEYQIKEAKAHRNKILEEAKKYNHVIDWAKNSRSSYSASIKKKIFQIAKKHMTKKPYKPLKWSKELVLEDAKRYNE